MKPKTRLVSNANPGYVTVYSIRTSSFAIVTRFLQYRCLPRCEMESSQQLIPLI
jgi:hypothetical protein